MKHTPGPWAVSQTDDWLFIRASGKLDAIVAQMELNSELCTTADEVEPGEQHHNASLIAACPEMFEALEHVDCKCSVAERDSGHLIGCFMPMVEAAIAKARGES